MQHLDREVVRVALTVTSASPRRGSIRSARPAPRAVPVSSAATDEDRVGDGVPRRRNARSRSTRLRVPIDEMAPIGPRRERAVVALRTRRRECAGTPRTRPRSNQSAVSVKARFRSKRRFRRVALRASGRAGRASARPRPSRPARRASPIDRTSSPHGDDPAVEVLPLHLDELQVPREHLERRTFSWTSLTTSIASFLPAADSSAAVVSLDTSQGRSCSTGTA